MSELASEVQEFDVLRDEGKAYARRLKEAGLSVKLLRCNGMIHGFLSLAGLIQRATGYFDQVIIEIRRMTANQVQNILKKPE